MKLRPLVATGQRTAAAVETGRSRKETSLSENSPVVVTEVKTLGWKSKFVKFFDVFVHLFQVRVTGLNPGLKKFFLIWIVMIISFVFSCKTLTSIIW